MQLNVVKQIDNIREKAVHATSNPKNCLSAYFSIKELFMDGRSEVDLTLLHCAFDNWLTFLNKQNGECFAVEN